MLGGVVVGLPNRSGRAGGDQVDQQSGRSNPEPGDEVRTPVAVVRPHMRGRVIPMLPRTLGVALVVGVLAFLAGVQVGPPRGTGPTVTVATPIPSESPAPTQAAAPTVLPDRSGFATAFDLIALAREAGLSACSGGSGGSNGGGRAYMIFSGRCSVPPSQQAALILKLEGEISAAIRATAISRDGGFAGSNSRDGSTVMSWDYRSDGFDGSIYLVATTAGSDLHVVVVLTEQLPL